MSTDRTSNPGASARYYDEHAPAFVAATVDADLAHLYAPFLERLTPGGLILDAGCGSGRDSRHFLTLGYRVEAFDASERMVESASALTGLEVQRMTFQEFESTPRFDGVWACASLLHVAKAEMPATLGRLAAALVPGGSLFASFKYGRDEGWRGERFFNDYDEETFAELAGGFPELEVVRVWTTGSALPHLPHKAGERWLDALLMRRGTPP